MVIFFLSRQKEVAPRVVQHGRKRRREGEGGTNKIVWSQWPELLWCLRPAWKWDRQAVAATLRLHCRSFFVVAFQPPRRKTGVLAFSACLLPHGLQVAFRRRTNIITGSKRGGGESCWRRAEMRPHDQAHGSTAKLRVTFPLFPSNHHNKKSASVFFFFFVALEKKKQSSVHKCSQL